MGSPTNNLLVVGVALTSSFLAVGVAPTNNLLAVGVALRIICSRENSPPFYSVTQLPHDRTF